MKKFLMIVLVAFCAFSSLEARRTARGQYFVDGKVFTSFNGMGGGVVMGRYTRLGYWYGGLDYFSGNAVANDEIGRRLNLVYVDASADGGYLFRLLSTRTRSVSVYAGGGGFLGCEFPDPWKQMPSDVVMVLGNTFLCGLYPQVNVECFISGPVALFMDVRMPVNFTSQISRVRVEMSIGVRVNL